jgi:3-hydroxyacyl-[acyl-carrier-protein] dehydratase
MRLETFQMIDRVTAVGDGRLEAEATVPEASPVFEGHFPGHPLVPGVLLVETMAQACGYLLLHRMRFARMPFLAAVREAKLRSFVGPGATLAVEASLVHEGSGYAVAAGRIASGGRRVCDVEITLRILDFPAPALAAAMRAQAARIGLSVPADGAPTGTAGGAG